MCRTPGDTSFDLRSDARQETARELATFLDAYLAALGGSSETHLSALVDSEATLWLSGNDVRGGEAVVAALLKVGQVSLSGVEWVVGTGRWEALCSAEIEWGDGRQQLTMLVKVVAGNWQLRYQHTG